MAVAENYRNGTDYTSSGMCSTSEYREEYVEHMPDDV